MKILGKVLLTPIMFIIGILIWIAALMFIVVGFVIDYWRGEL